MADLQETDNRGRKPWPLNPLVTLVRQHSGDIINDTIERYDAKHGFRASQFDLVLQVMIIACSYSPAEIWLADNNDVEVASEFMKKGAPDMAGEVLEYAIEHRHAWLNARLIKKIARQQIARLHKIHADRKEEFNLPMHVDRAVSHFTSGSKLTGLRLKNICAENGMYEAVAIERGTGEKVIFRSLDLRASKAYIESFHYLHVAREDDVLSFGAFVEGEEVPFALVSYAQVGRAYKENMLRAIGIEASETLELTRAWSSERAPKNTMSMLYGYAHANIQRLWQTETGTSLRAILTAVNPNLGFKGSAFRAVGFGVIGEKPTAYHYLIDKKGKKSFTVRRKLVTLPKESLTPARVATASMPLLPTKELAVILNGRKRLTPMTDIMYAISEEEYRHEGHYTLESI